MPSPKQHSDQRHSPPAVRRNWIRPVALGGAGLIVGVLMLIVVFNIEPGQTDGDALPADDDVIELLAPERLRETDKQAGATDPMRDVQLRLEQGGWVQVADPETGELSQQYRCSRLDPDPPDTPDGYMQMKDPRAEVFLDDGRVLTLAGETALTYAPNRALESGTLAGNVIIRLYELDERRSPDPAIDEPVLVLNTEQAEFDHYLGEVNCNDSVRIETPQATIPGRGLTLQYNDQLERIELLRMREVDYIQLRALAPDDSSPVVEPNTPGGPSDESTARDEASSSSPDKRSTPPGAGRPETQQDNTHADRVQYYRLTLDENVVIEQRSGGQLLRTARGDELIAHFSNETKGLDRALGSIAPARGHDNRLAISGASRRWSGMARLRHRAWPVVLAASALGVTQPSVEESSANPNRDQQSASTITFDGPLLIEPVASDDVSALSMKTNEAHFQLTGQPVRVDDTQRSLSATGHQLTFRTGRERMALAGTPNAPVRVQSSQLTAEAEQFWMNQTDRRGRLAGAGWMRTGEPATASASGDGNNASARELKITWQHGVDLELAESEVGEGSFLSGATFAEEVHVLARDFELDCDSLHVAFRRPDAHESASEAQQQRIKTIDAHGNVHARGIDRDGLISCESLRVELEADETGQMTLSRMFAKRSVRAEHKQQIVWCDSLDVMFRPADDASQREHASSEDSADTVPLGGNVTVDTLVADDNVQVRLKDGTRAFADQMIGDAIDETVVLKGDDVLMLAEQTIIDQGTRVEVRNATQTATWRGSGRFLSYQHAFNITQTARIHRPQINADYNPADAEVRATWRESLIYDANYNDGAGSVTLTGNVQAISSPSANQRDTVTADTLTLDFVKANGRANNASDIGQRQLEQLTARGDAKLESRAWMNAERTDLPRIFYIEGQDIQYNEQTMHAVVNGAGQVFVVDEQITNTDQSAQHTDGGDAQPAGASPDPFAGKGRTSFTWSRKLEMTRAADQNQFAIDLFGEVAVRHLSIDDTTGMLTCDELSALIERPTADEPSRPGAMNLGGPAELLRLSGHGNVFVDTPTREVECDHFDYDRTTGMAEVSATANRQVVVHTTGTAQPIRAEHVTWNMIEDTMTIERASGRGG